ncbi:RHS repeat-associated core domain-containing protein, partial [Stenotrophomonas sp. MH181796]
MSDAATGLSYMQQRYMDPQLGVFLSMDPVTAYDQPVGQFNRYRYAN